MQSLVKPCNITFTAHSHTLQYYTISCIVTHIPRGITLKPLLWNSTEPMQWPTHPSLCMSAVLRKKWVLSGRGNGEGYTGGGERRRIKRREGSKAAAVERIEMKGRERRRRRQIREDDLRELKQRVWEAELDRQTNGGRQNDKWNR